MLAVVSTEYVVRYGGTVHAVLRNGKGGWCGPRAIPTQGREGRISGLVSTFDAKNELLYVPYRLPDLLPRHIQCPGVVTALIDRIRGRHRAGASVSDEVGLFEATGPSR